MGHIRITVQMTDEEVAKLDRAAEALAANTKEGVLRVTRASVIRGGALAYANELLGIKSKKEKE